MKTLLLAILLIILPISNKQILKNMGEGFSLVHPETYYMYQQNNTSSPRKAIGNTSYTVYANDGTPFKVSYIEVSAFGYGYYRIINDAGLDLDTTYWSLDSLIAAVNAAVEKYNMSMPIGPPICLLLFGLLYLLKKRKTLS